MTDLAQRRAEAGNAVKRWECIICGRKYQADQEPTCPCGLEDGANIIEALEERHD